MKNKKGVNLFMKGTKTGEVYIQNEGLREVYNQTYQNIMQYINDVHDVVEGNNTISAYSLYSILKSYYGGLDYVMNTDSIEVKELIDSINSYIANGYKKIVSVKKSNGLLQGFNNLLRKMKKNNLLYTVNKRYLGIKFSIRKYSTNAVFDIVEDGKYKKLILCRDLESQDLYFGKNSTTIDSEVIKFIHDKLINLFDIIDAYRNVLPEPIDADLTLDDYACGTYEYAKYAIPFESKVVTGEIFVNSNGYVDVDMEIAKGIYPYYYRTDNYSSSLKDLIRERKMDILKKVPVDVNSIEAPIKEIVDNHLANNCNIKR